MAWLVPLQRESEAVRGEGCRFSGLASQGRSGDVRRAQASERQTTGKMRIGLRQELRNLANNQFGVTALFIPNPIVFAVSPFPAVARLHMFRNPSALIVEQVRVVVTWGIVPGWGGLKTALGTSGLVAWPGFTSFKRARRGLADVLQDLSEINPKSSER